MAIDRDRSIIAQVAAKQATELTKDVEVLDLKHWLEIYEYVRDAILLDSEPALPPSDVQVALTTPPQQPAPLQAPVVDNRPLPPCPVCKERMFWRKSPKTKDTQPDAFCSNPSCGQQTPDGQRFMKTGIWYSDWILHNDGQWENRRTGQRIQD